MGVKGRARSAMLSLLHADIDESNITLETAMCKRGIGSKNMSQLDVIFVNK